MSEDKEKPKWKRFLSSMTILGLISTGSNSCAKETVKNKKVEGELNQTQGYSTQHRQLVKELEGKGIKSKAVLNALESIPRHQFVPESLKNSSYDDNALPIGLKQTISQPYIVAFMTESLGLKSSDRVLEVGTGSGYQAAVLSRLVEKVYSIELLSPLAIRAKKTLDGLKISNVEIKTGDGYKGWVEHAPYDAIIVTAAPQEVPKVLIEQLKDGGKLILPVGKGDVQWLVLIVKKNGQVQKKQLIPVRFVPMVHGESNN